MSFIQLDIEYNNIGDRGAKSLSSALKNFNKLNYLNLNLHHNNIGF